MRNYKVTVNTEEEQFIYYITAMSEDIAYGEGMLQYLSCGGMIEDSLDVLVELD